MRPKLTVDIPQEYSVAGDVNRPTDLWAYSYFAYNDTRHDCGIRVNRSVMADNGLWKVMVVSPHGERYSVNVSVHVTRK